MASRTIAGQLWPEGTVVSAYPSAAWPDPSRSPSGTAISSGTVTGGSVTLTGLVEDVRYVAYGAPKGVTFVVPSVRISGDRARIDALEETVGTASEPGTGVGAAIYDFDAEEWGARPEGHLMVFWIGPAPGPTIEDGFAREFDQFIPTDVEE